VPQPYVLRGAHGVGLRGVVQVENSVYAAFCARLGLDSISQFQEEDVKQREVRSRVGLPMQHA